MPRFVWVMITTTLHTLKRCMGCDWNCSLAPLRLQYQTEPMECTRVGTISKKEKLQYSYCPVRAEHPYTVNSL